MECVAKLDVAIIRSNFDFEVFLTHDNTLGGGTTRNDKEYEESWTLRIFGRS